MMIVKGRVVQGCKHFEKRMTNFRSVFCGATGEELFPGTLNVKVDGKVPINEHFRIRGVTIGEPDQDLLFEICRANGIWAYRIRPYNLHDGTGGHGDDTIEIACRQQIPNIGPGSPVEVAFFRNETDKAIFGFPDFADIVFAAHGPALRLAYGDSHLANEMFGALPKQMSLEQIVIYMLVRMTSTGWVELLTLVGHGAGLGAMKIARGMFETAVMAEYLRVTPTEIEDYFEYGRVLDLKRMKLYPGFFSPEKVLEIEAEYNRVAPRFMNSKRKVRNHWNKNSIAFMARKIGREQQYELPYAMAASIHHGNFEAMIAHLSGDETQLDIDQPPSLGWVKQGLVSGHLYLLQALDTLNDFFKLGFDSRIKAASDGFEKVWSKQGAP